MSAKQNHAEVLLNLPSIKKRYSSSNSLFLEGRGKAIFSYDLGFAESVFFSINNN